MLRRLCSLAVICAAFVAAGALVLGPARPPRAGASLLGEVTKLLASDAETVDDFGASVAVSGDIIVVGAYKEDSGGSEAGAAYVFQRDAGGPDAWGEVTKLTASDAEAGDSFGRSVAASGDVVVAGAFGEDAGGSGAGAAYVFQRDHGGPDNWGEVAKLTASDPAPGDFFGQSVALSNDTLVVGAPRDDAGGNDAGAAYVFQRNAGGEDAWGQVTKLTASDAEADDVFGWSVAVSGDTAVVGALQEDAGGSEAGAAYVFQRDAGGANAWGQVRKLTASDAAAGDGFGDAVAVDGEIAIVGAFHEDARGDDAGAAYVFQRDAGGADAWGQVRKLTAHDTEAGDTFGRSVDVDGGAIIVGADRADAAGGDAGAAHVFARNQDGADRWGEVGKLTASDAQAADHFGFSVAIGDGTAAGGAFGEDTGGSSAGAAYVFEELASKPTPAPAQMPGDADCNGAVTSVDAALILQHVAGRLAALRCPAGADANGDGAVSSVDAALVLQYAAGLIRSLTP